MSLNEPKINIKNEILRIFKECDGLRFSESTIKVSQLLTKFLENSKNKSTHIVRNDLIVLIGSLIALNFNIFDDPSVMEQLIHFTCELTAILMRNSE